MPSKPGPSVSEAFQQKGTMAALRALAGRLATDMDAAEYAVDEATLARALRPVLLALNQLEQKQNHAGASPQEVASPVDDLIQRRQQRQSTKGRPGSVA